MVDNNVCECCGAMLRRAAPGRLDRIPGNEHAKRAAEVAAAGGHSLALIAERENWVFARAIGRWAARQGIAAFVVEPCVCGQYGSQSRTCLCSAEMVATHRRIDAYQNAVQADIVVVAPAVAPRTVERYLGRLGEPDEAILARIAAAREREAAAPDDEASRHLLRAALRSPFLEPAEAELVRDVARTIARLAGETAAGPAHLAEAIQYRPGPEFRDNSR